MLSSLEIELAKSILRFPEEGLSDIFNLLLIVLLSQLVDDAIVGIPLLISVEFSLHGVKVEVQTFLFGL